MENNIKPADGSQVVLKSEALKILKEHDFKVCNNELDSFVSLKDINKIYPNGVQAVYDFNIDIRKNDFIVLVGPSGCGKSTTLRMVAGLEDITSGYLYIDKVLANYLPSKDRDISMVFQSYALYPQMTVYDNIAFPLRARKYSKPVVSFKLLACKEARDILNKPDEYIEALHEANDKDIKFGTKAEYIATKLHIIDYTAKLLIKYHFNSKDDLNIEKNGVTLRKLIEDKISSIENKERAFLKKKNYDINENFEILENGSPIMHNVKLTKEEIRAKVFEAARILDLGPYLDRKPKELSGGQMQRVALGRAIVRDAKLFLMDEPLSNLDAKLRVQMRSEIVRLHEAIGATTIYVTHDQTEAMTMATKIAVMSKGWVQQVGTPQEIYYNPKNIFVATFIGSPAMNIFDGVYDNGKVEFKNGFRVEMKEEFKLKHDSFYKEKIDDLERMLNQPDFMKMHAIKLIDEVLYKKNKPQISESLIENVIKKAQLLGHEIEDMFNQELREYIININELKASMALAMDNNKNILLSKLKEIVAKIDDSYALEALELINANLKQEYPNDGTKYYNSFIEKINLLRSKISKLAGTNDLLNDLNKLDLENACNKEDNTLLLQIRKPLLTFEKISSADIGKLHNAQVFSEEKTSEEKTLYYEHTHKKKKKLEVRVNLNSCNIEFVNNLYTVASELLANCRKALEGTHNIRIGVRPEDIHLNNEYDDSNKTGSFVVNSNIVELLGSELLVHTEFGGSKMIAKISTGTLIKPHTDCEFTMNGNKILIFDSLSGDKI